VAAARVRGDRVLVCDIPLLFEAGLEDEVDVVLLIDAPRELRLERLVRDRGLSRAEALAMIDAQLPSGEKRARSDYVIDNDGTRDALRTRAGETWRSIERDRLP
jgi:dephospho-CoA kinase